MITNHFLKSLILFTSMIVLGLIGVFLVSYFDKDNEQANMPKKDCTLVKC